MANNDYKEYNNYSQRDKESMRTAADDKLVEQTDDVESKLTSIDTSATAIRADVGTIKSDISTIKSRTTSIQNDVSSIYSAQSTITQMLGTLIEIIATDKIKASPDAVTLNDQIGTAESTIATYGLVDVHSWINPQVPQELEPYVQVRAECDPMSATVHVMISVITFPAQDVTDQVIIPLVKQGGEYIEVPISVTVEANMAP